MYAIRSYYDFINTKRFTKYRKESQNKPKDETLWLITSKSVKSINTQFVRDNRVLLNPGLGFADGEKVNVSSEHGEFIFEVKCSEDLVITSYSIHYTKLYD